jgi:hypothetical protein
MELALVRDVHADVLHPDDIERIVGKGPVESPALMHFDEGLKTRQPVQHRCAGAEIARQLEAVDAATERGGQQPCRAGQPSADIENPVLPPNPARATSSRGVVPRK